jgi:hypothetical protein
MQCVGVGRTGKRGGGIYRDLMRRAKGRDRITVVRILSSQETADGIMYIRGPDISAYARYDFGMGSWSTKGPK